MQTVLIIEDKKSLADMLTQSLQAEGLNVITAGNVRDGIALLSPDIDALVTDLKLPDGNGMEILANAKKNFPFLPVIVMTAYGSIELAVKAVKEGAYDFITKPFEPDHLMLLIKRAMDDRLMQKENTIYKKVFSRFIQTPEIIGVSSEWQLIMEKVNKVAPLKTTVLILGESGTGKELIARAIHHRSRRADEAFIAINCAAISKDLIESELFGHEKGAFTGAVEVKPGRFELANKGTIFLDEIGDMSLSLQARLLRVLQESEFERVGGTKTIKVDLRIIAASNKNLENEVQSGHFREDLFYRLNVFPIVIPPLRGRCDDILPLANRFIKYFCSETGKKDISMDPEVEKFLLQHEWKGNVRELKNVIERAVILCDRQTLLPEHFNLYTGATDRISGSDDSLHEVAESAARHAEKLQIENALRLTKGNKSKAAEMLKVSYKTLLNKIKEYGINLS